MTALRAAIHARRSTDQQETSLTRQIEEARAFAARKGWTVADEHLFYVDEVSGAVGQRPDLDALVVAVKERPRPFDVLVIQNEDRLTRVMWKQLGLLTQLQDLGVQVFRYSDGQEVRGATAADKLMMAVNGFQSESERERLVQRTREASHWRGRHGWVVGGKLFGYDNVRVGEGPGSHVDRVINEDQAAIVRRIFAEHAAGASQRGIARALNADGIPSPRAGKRGIGTWASTAIRSMLINPHFRGEIIAGRKRREIVGGRKVFVDVPEADWLRVHREDLRIVDEETWQAVAQRFADRPSFKARGPRPRGILVGNMVCSACGGRMYLVGGTGGLGRRYACGRRHQGGDAACGNATKRPGPLLDRAVAESIADRLTNADFVDAVARRALKQARAAHAQDNAELREAEHRLEKARRRIDNLVDLIADTDDRTRRKALAQRFPDLEAQVARVEAQVDRLRAEKPAPQNDEKDLAEWRALISNLPDLLLADARRGRALLQSVLREPLRATAIEVNGENRFLISGLLRPTGLVQKDGDPNGIRTRVAWMKTRCPGPD
jgi:site-specific DNA recombinase